MKVEVAVLGSPSLIVRTVSVEARAQELCKSRGGRPGLPVPNSPYGPCGCKSGNIELELVVPYIRCNSLVKVTACVFNNISKWQQERRVWGSGKGGGQVSDRRAGHKGRPCNRWVSELVRCLSVSQASCGRVFSTTVCKCKDEEDNPRPGQWW